MPTDASPQPLVVHATSCHDPLDVRIFHKEAVSLAERFGAVSIVAPGPGPVQAKGVDFTFIPRFQARWRRMLGGPWAVFRAVRRLKPSLVHVHDPELIPVGLALRALGHVVVYDAHEDLPGQVLSKAWIPAPIRHPIRWFCLGLNQLVSRCFSGVVAATPQILGTFAHPKRVLVQNFPLQDDFPAANHAGYTERGRVVIYVGGLTKIRGSREMVEAVRLANARLSRPLELWVVGPIDGDSTECFEAPLASEQVKVFGKLSREELPALMAQARAGLVLFHPVPNHLDAQPNKLFEYMAAGLPIVGSDFPLWRELVLREACGELVDPTDPQAIAEALISVVEDEAKWAAFAQRGPQVIQARYTWESQKDVLFGLYQSLLGPSAEPQASGPPEA